MKLNFLSFAAATLSLHFVSGSIRAGHEPYNFDARNRNLEEGWCGNLAHHFTNQDGSCNSPSSDTADSVVVTTYNTFMLWCLPGVPCEPAAQREVRAPKIPVWFEDRDDDIVFMQEMWSNTDAIKQGMHGAGFCGQATCEDEDYGSGLGIFTKFEILETEFIDWCDSVCGDAPACSSPESITDKGVLYAKIKHPDGTIIHAFNTHTESDSTSNMHETRMGQYRRMKEFIDRKNLPADEMVFMGGDFNEDYFCQQRDNEVCPDKYSPVCDNREYYERMLGALGANSAVFNDIGNDLFTYNNVLNQLTANKYDNEECPMYKQRLDYVLYSNEHKRPNLDTSSCHVERALDPDGYDLSDHLPVTCTYNFTSFDEEPEDPMYVTVKSIKCIEREDSSWFQDDEIVVVINDQQVWPGPDPSQHWETFNTNDQVNLSTDDKRMLKRNIDDLPVYCLRELDTGDDHNDIGCMQWDPSDIQDLQYISAAFVWDRTLENEEGLYEIVFEVSSDADWTS